MILGKTPGELIGVSYEEVVLLLDVHDREQRDLDRRRMRELGYMLGTTWDVDEPDPSTRTGPRPRQEYVTFPLAFAIGMSGMNGTKGMMKAIDKQRTRARQENSGELDPPMSAKEYFEKFGPLVNRLYRESHKGKR